MFEILKNMFDKHTNSNTKPSAVVARIHSNETVTNESLARSYLLEGTSSTAIAWLEYLDSHEFYGIAQYVLIDTYSKFPFNPTILNLIGRILINMKEYTAAWNTYTSLIRCRQIDIQKQEAAYQQLASLINQIPDTSTIYPQTLIQQLTDRLRRLSQPGGRCGLLPLITITMTSCRRLELFKRTVNSFLQCCEDLELIDRWICIDDNSNPEDRKEMSTLYPFIEYIWKRPEQKGHAESLNILLQTVDTPFRFHMEDDWRFVIRMPYLRMCLSVLETNPNLGQCLVNRNYSETMVDLRIRGGIEGSTAEGWLFRTHEYLDEGPERQRRIQEGAGCIYWPHFSLRVGMIRTSIMHQLDPFMTEPGPFEYIYANKYRDSGYETAFLDGIGCLHIGRLTSERFGDTDNAYTLNETSQFGEPIVNHDDGESGESGDSESGDSDTENRYSETESITSNSSSSSNSSSQNSGSGESRSLLTTYYKKGSSQSGYPEKKKPSPEWSSQNFKKPSPERSSSYSFDELISKRCVRGDLFEPSRFSTSFYEIKTWAGERKPCNSVSKNTQHQDVINSRPEIALDIDIYIINLDRRPDRWARMRPNLRALHAKRVYRVSAVDGLELKPTRRMEQLFNDNDYRFRRGIIGCALSHIALWTQFAKYVNIEEYRDRPIIVLEDDLTFDPSTMQSGIKYILDQRRQKTCIGDVIFLGHHKRSLVPENLDEKLDDKFDTNRPQLELSRWTYAHTQMESLGGTGGYMITPTGALGLLQYIHKYGMINAIDTMMHRACDFIPIYNCEPHLFQSPVLTTENLLDVDTDIQRDHDSSLMRDIETRLNEEALIIRSLDPNPMICSKESPIDHTCQIVRDHVILCQNHCCGSDSEDISLLSLPSLQSHENKDKYHPYQYNVGYEWRVYLPSWLPTSYLSIGLRNANGEFSVDDMLTYKPLPIYHVCNQSLDLEE